MSNPKRQHWVPCFYLRYFATPETRQKKEPKVWILSKDAGDATLVSVTKVANKRYLYSPEDEQGNRLWDIESRFALYEGLMQSIWPTLTQDFVDLHGDEALRKGLALFISLLYLRHPRRLAEVERIHAQFVHLYDPLPKDDRGNPDVQEVEVNGIVYPFDDTDWHRYRTADSNEKKRMFVSYLKHNATDLAERLMKKRWSVIVSEEPVFITTDNPVTAVHTTRAVFGLATPGVVISFPLSPNRVLVMDDRHDQPKGNYYPLSSNGPGPQNITAWRNCDRFMISPRHPDKVCAELLSWT